MLFVIYLQPCSQEIRTDIVAYRRLKISGIRRVYGVCPYTWMPALQVATSNPPFFDVNDDGFEASVILAGRR